MKYDYYNDELCFEVAVVVIVVVVVVVVVPLDQLIMYADHCYSWGYSNFYYSFIIILYYLLEKHTDLSHHRGLGC